MKRVAEHPWQQVVWLGMSLRVPADWEILRHSVRDDRGRLVFADQRHGRLLLSWGKCAAPPDIKRMFEDYRARDLKEDSQSRFTDFQGHPFAANATPASHLAGWMGYRRQRQDQLHNEECLTRAGRHDDIHARWVEAVLPWPNGLDPAIEQQVLSGFAVLDDRQGPAHWRAFGLELISPPGWRLKEATIKPAEAVLRFTDRRRQAIIRRLGAVDAWYDGDAQRYLKRQLDVASLQITPTQYQGAAAVLAKAKEPAKGWRRLIGAKTTRLDLVWSNLPAGSLYHVTTRCPLGEEVQPTDFSVTPAVPEGVRL
ncbi:MAG: hypothetical protein IT443_11655 [Phycisphaeraceae bacterium]|nr:hypothetical protein [Phycisphaeraceae bacterium]